MSSPGWTSVQPAARSNSSTRGDGMPSAITALPMTNQQQQQQRNVIQPTTSVETSTLTSQVATRAQHTIRVQRHATPELTTGDMQIGELLASSSPAASVKQLPHSSGTPVPARPATSGRTSAWADDGGTSSIDGSLSSQPLHNGL